MRKGNEKFNTMITEQLMAQEDIRRAADAEAKVTRRHFRENHDCRRGRGECLC